MFFFFRHDGDQQSVELSTGYLLPTALALGFNLTTIVACQHQPLSAAYLEISGNSTTALPTATATATTGAGASTGTSSSSNSSSSGHQGISGAAIGGIVAALVVVTTAIALGVLACVLVRRRRRRTQDAEEPFGGIRAREKKAPAARSRRLPLYTSTTDPYVLDHQVLVWHEQQAESDEKGGSSSGSRLRVGGAGATPVASSADAVMPVTTNGGCLSSKKATPCLSIPETKEKDL